MHHILQIHTHRDSHTHTHADKRTLYIFIAQSDNIPITTCSNGVGNRQSFSNIGRPTMSNPIEISVSKPFWCASKSKINCVYGNDAAFHRILYHHHVNETNEMRYHFKLFLFLCVGFVSMKYIQLNISKCMYSLSYMWLILSYVTRQFMCV